jgi:hypothetical protein
MRIKGSRLSAFIILLVIIRLCVNCAPEACLEETISTLNATFYKTGSTQVSIADSITIFGIGKDTSKIYDKTLKVSFIKLPLDASSGTCGFVMKINDVTDTLRLTYTSYPHLVSKECGVVFFYTLKSYQISATTVDTIIFRNNNITTFNEENIRIFY